MEKTQLLVSAEVAKLLRIKTNTLAIWRVRGVGPSYHKIGRRVVYSESDVTSWLDSQKHLSFDVCSNR